MLITRRYLNKIYNGSFSPFVWQNSMFMGNNYCLKKYGNTNSENTEIIN